MEKKPGDTPEAKEAREKQLDQVDFWARMDLVAEHEYSGRLLTEELPDIPAEVYAMPDPDKIAWLRKRTGDTLDEMTAAFDSSGDEAAWRVGQHDLLESHKQAIRFLDLLGTEDYGRFHELEESDEVFRARYANSFSDSMHWSPLEP